MKNKCLLFCVGWIFLTVVFFVAFAAAIAFLDLIIMPEEYLFYEHTPLCGQLLAPLIVIPSIIFAYIIIHIIMKKKTSEDYDPFKIFALSAKLGKCKIAILAAYFLSLYICLTSVTCVTADGILVKTPFDPVGKEYSYADVERIEAGFGEKKRAFYDYEQKGSFYYKVILDGKERIFHMPTVNGDIERYNDTYLELEEFDAALKALNIPKYASKKGYENCKFDSRYIERFLRILDD